MIGCWIKRLVGCDRTAVNAAKKNTKKKVVHVQWVSDHLYIWSNQELDGIVHMYQDNK